MATSANRSSQRESLTVTRIQAFQGGLSHLLGVSRCITQSSVV